MAIPKIVTIEGQGGNIKIAGFVIQVSTWVIRKMFRNSDVTTTGSGGWAENKRVLAAWDFQADWPYDISKAGQYEGVVLRGGMYIPIGLEGNIAADCTFQLGASGTPLVPGSTAFQYRGSALISSTGPMNPAHDVVHFTISGQGTGALLGPLQGMIT